MEIYGKKRVLWFYDNLISSGTKIQLVSVFCEVRFYDNLISSGTKIDRPAVVVSNKFYDNLISSGTKITAFVYKINC